MSRTNSKTIVRRKGQLPKPRSEKPHRNGVSWDLRLYVAGKTPNSIAAFANLSKFCETHLKGEYRIEVIDLMKHPQEATRDQIFAVPTLVRKLPEPIRKILGDLSNTERVLVGLDLRRRMS